MSTYVLTNYPLSSKYRASLERQLSLTPTYVTVSEIRQRSLGQILKYLRRLRGETLLLPLEDENSIAILPVLEMMATISRAKMIQIILPDGENKPFYRWEAPKSFLSFLRASADCVLSIRQCNRELTALEKADVVIPKKTSTRRVLYLNANLWFGVKAGGSVGHIAGVVNGLLKLGHQVEFVSAGSRLMVRPEASYTQLAPPRGYGLPFDGNYYAFHRQTAASVDEMLRTHDVSFIYQRMSIANYAGVLLSRKHQFPLVLEYNGSEVWVSRSWGRPLSHPKIASKAEDVCLRHAHAVVTVSDVLRDELVGRGVPIEKIISYPNCIDENIFDPQKFTRMQIRDTRARYGIDPDATVISFLGTFGQWHGVEIMGEAIRLLATRNRDFLERTKTHFLIIGDGMKMTKLQEILQNDRCKKFYSLPGLVRQEEAAVHLASADILLSPHVPNSDGTAFFGSPTKLFEYMAMAKAIIASDLDQLGEVLKNSLRSQELPAGEPTEGEARLAVLCPPGNPAELAKAISFLVNRRPWRDVLGRNARKEALAKYTWQHHVTAIKDRLKKLDLVTE